MAGISHVGLKRDFQDDLAASVVKTEYADVRIVPSRQLEQLAKLTEAPCKWNSTFTNPNDLD